MNGFSTQREARRADAWGRYRRLMRWMVAASALVAILALLWLRESFGPMPIHMVIATVLGVMLTMLLGTGLMGLVFASHDSGHDEDADEAGRR